MIAIFYGCCLADIPDTAEDGATWTCSVCGTRWVYMYDRTKASWYRSKVVAHA